MSIAFEKIPADFRASHHLAGVDEVGRGPLAGPVVAAAVILPAGFDETGLADSKTLSSAQREAMAERLLKTAFIGLAFVPAQIIDAINIRQASLLAMRRAVAALPVLPDGVLVDGRDVPPGLPCKAAAFIKGDGRFAVIAAASILAKCARDRMMMQAECYFPGYGLARHMGYPTAQHRQALQEKGISALHRLSFGPCRPASS
jgi:ribonuclease HII